MTRRLALWPVFAAALCLVLIGAAGAAILSGDQERVPPRSRLGGEAGAPTWAADFEGPTIAEWSSFRRSDGGTMYAADAAREGITAASGSGIAHLEVTAAQQKAGTIHSKLLKMWALKPPETSWRDDARRRLERLPNDSPAGVYAASFYLPPDYVKSEGDWTNIFQFKESYLDPNGTWHQDPQWWLNLTRADDWSPEIRPAGSSRGDPVILASHWRATEERPGQVVAVPRGRWFEIKADLYPSNRIDWYIDGTFFGSSPASTYPVGISKRRAVGWSFGVGHYGGVGKLWVDDVSFTSR